MARNILNEGPEVNVYLNRDPIEATLPVLATQAAVTDPITISLKGLSGFTGQAGKVMKVNSGETALEYADDNDTNFWQNSNNNLRPLSTSDRLIIGTETGSFNTSTALTIKNSNAGLAGFYTNGKLDINNEDNGNIIYLATDKGNSNDIYFGSANSDNTGSNSGVLLRNNTDTNDNHIFKINSVSGGINTNRINIDLPTTNDTKLQIKSSTNSFLQLGKDNSNYVDLKYTVGSPNGSFSSVYYDQNLGTQNLFTYTHNATSSSRQLRYFPITMFENDVKINNIGTSGNRSKLIFTNDQNTDTFTFEADQYLNTFTLTNQFGGNSADIFSFNNSNAPNVFTMSALFKFGSDIYNLIFFIKIMLSLTSHFTLNSSKTIVCFDRPRITFF